MEIIENNKKDILRTYEKYKEDTYKYRVDEILGNIETTNSEYIDFHTTSENLYKELQEMLDTNGKKLLLSYNDAETDKRGCELYALAEQIYKDLKEENER